MKRKLSIIGKLAGATILFAVAADIWAGRTLILLQENTGSTCLDKHLEEPARTAARALIDSVVETNETDKFCRLAASHYQRFINLSDARCTRADLLQSLIDESRDGNTVDLAILGHGNNNLLVLFGKERLVGGEAPDEAPELTVRPNGDKIGYIRTLLKDARTRTGNPSFKFKLRLVHMCNCVGSSVNDDWTEIGAQTSVGTVALNYMPEPTLTWFWEDFVMKNKTVYQAASDSYNAAKGMWQFIISPERVEDSRPIVAGNGKLIFRDECQMRLNETRTVEVSGKRIHNFANIYFTSGQRYRLQVFGSWNSGADMPNRLTNVGGNGYAPPEGTILRFRHAKMMSLIGEMTRSNDSTSVMNASAFAVGSELDHTANQPGFLTLYANEKSLYGNPMFGNLNYLSYQDNSGSLTVRITRIQ